MPMRAGGKYKDLIKRAKGDATVAAEAMARAKKIQEEYVKLTLQKRQRELLAGAALRASQEQLELERKQRVLTMLLGGRKGDAKKFFKAWCKGTEIVKNEKMNEKRDRSWRRSCRCSEHEQNMGCCFTMALQDPRFQLPFDTMRQTGGLGLAPFQREDRGLDAPSESSGINSRADLMLFGGVDNTTEPMLYGKQPQLEGRGAPANREVFLEGEVTEVAHHSSGKRCFVDSMYRMVYADPLERRRPHSRVIRTNGGPTTTPPPRLPHRASAMNPMSASAPATAGYTASSSFSLPEVSDNGRRTLVYG